MTAIPNLKNQHYVWRYYLSAWETSGTFWCFRNKAKKMFPAQSKGIASETYFYRTYQLTAGDKQYLKALIARASDENLRRLNQEAVDLFQKSFELRERLKVMPLSRQAKLAIERELQLIEKTMGERYHSGIENKSKSILDSLRQKNADFYHDEVRCGDFVYFLCNQYFRTAKMRQAIGAVESPIPGHDPHRTANIECHIYATNVSVGLFRDRKSYQIVFRDNDTPIPFITGDQPVVNMLAPTATDDLELYYPLSPKLALILTKNNQKFPSQMRRATELEVEHYNYTMFSRSEDQVYSDDETYLRSLVSIGKNVLPL